MSARASGISKPLGGITGAGQNGGAFRTAEEIVLRRQPVVQAQSQFDLHALERRSQPSPANPQSMLESSLSAGEFSAEVSPEGLF